MFLDRWKDDASGCHTCATLREAKHLIRRKEREMKGGKLMGRESVWDQRFAGPAPAGLNLTGSVAVHMVRFSESPANNDSLSFSEQRSQAGR
ncbi:MAG: hypothetical protein OJF47_003073 [Nitrospira sp.]|jgi:hypothetical protein|nr:MAG: hypothetical protein OJF47_003073 [Nitrospira sp.]